MPNIFTGSGAGETIRPGEVSGSVVSNPPGASPGNGFDFIDARGGNDIVSAGGGNDSILLGDGDDLFVWYAGDGSDTIDGGNGVDALDFFGSTGKDAISISANAGAAEVTHGGSTVSLSNLEIVNVYGLGAVDSILVADLTGTHVTEVKVDLGIGGSGDGAFDQLYVETGDGADQIALTFDSGAIGILGAAAAVTVIGADASDTLFIDGRAGNDVIDASAIPAGHMNLMLYGGRGNDSIIGSLGNDTLLGGEGDDRLIGGKGRDRLDGHQGSDVLEGGKGADQFFFTELGSGMNGFDKIRDFKPGKDSIAFDANPLFGDKVNKFEFHIGKKAHDADDRLIYSDSKGVLSYDGDGKGGVAAVAFAKLGKGLDLSHKDFDVIPLLN